MNFLNLFYMNHFMRELIKPIHNIIIFTIPKTLIPQLIA